MAASQAPSGVKTAQFQLGKECELRVEIGDDSRLRLRLVSGTAEIFGTELPPQNWLSFPPGHKFVVLIVFIFAFYIFAVSSVNVIIRNWVLKI